MKKLKPYVILHLILFISSLGGICSKTAAGKPFLSFDFCFYYGLTLFILIVYALVWQQILKSVPLNIAYVNKSVTLIWGMIWGTIVFKEQITLTNIIGAAAVIAGVLIMTTGGEKNE